MAYRGFRLAENARYRAMIGVGGIGTGMFFALEGDHNLGRNESRPGRLLDCRDYCKLHIISHFTGVMTGADSSGRPFHVIPVGKVGGDDAGLKLKKEMAAAGLDTTYVEEVSGSPTMISVCFQYPDGAGGNITSSNAASCLMSLADVDRAAPLFARYGKQAIALAAPEVPLEIRKHLLAAATRHGALRVAAFASTEMNAAKELGMFKQIDLLAMNEDEAASMTGISYEPTYPDKLLDACSTTFRLANPLIRLVISAGANGAYGFDGNEWGHCPVAPVKVKSSAGAGDTLLGGILAGLAAGLPLVVPGPKRLRMSERPLASALEMGVLLASMSVTSQHTIHPDACLETLVAFAGERGIAFAESVQKLLPKI